MKSETESKPNLKQAVPFFGESVRYYLDGLGFEMTIRWIDGGVLRWCWLERGGARNGPATQIFARNSPVEG